MINVNQGQTHYFTNRSNQDTIHFKPGPGETLVLHGNIDPPPLVELEFPIEGDIVLSDTIMTQRMYLHSDHTAGITIDSNKLIIKTNSAYLSIPNNGEILTFNNPSGKAGRVDVNGLVTNYRTNSDYRIKYGVTPMSNTNYLSKINLLDPKYFKIKCKKCLDQLDSNCECDNVVHEGFIAHELEEIFPKAVNGVKDSIDENGNPLYQSIDTNFMIAGIVSAVKELDSTIENAMERTGYLEDFLG